MSDETLTTKEAAELLNITPSRVRQMVLTGRLPAVKFGRDLVIHRKDLALVAERKPGRPASKALGAKKTATKKSSKKGPAAK